MNARTIRRAIERKALKEARKADRQQPGIPTENTPEAAPRPISEARLKANRANALHSTGPASERGKSKVSLNATKTALTGKTVLLPSDDVAIYELHLQRFHRDWQPVGDRESELVQTLADTQWRLNRIPSLEMAIYALARVEFAQKFAEYEPAEAAALTEAQAFITYHRQLNNLSIQEARLRRQYQKDAAELVKLQQDRANQEPEKSLKPVTVEATQSAPAFATLDNGFEFSSGDLDTLEDHLDLDSEPLELPEAA